MGSGADVTNVFSPTTSGVPSPIRIFSIYRVDKVRTVVINYNFDQIPDTMHIYTAE